jgi:hypothetical protein
MGIPGDQQRNVDDTEIFGNEGNNIKRIADGLKALTAGVGLNCYQCKLDQTLRATVAYYKHSFRTTVKHLKILLLLCFPPFATI